MHSLPIRFTGSANNRLPGSDDDRTDFFTTDRSDHIFRIIQSKNMNPDFIVADEPIVVQDSSSINVEVEASQTSYGGTIFYNTIIENTGDFALEAFEWVPLIESYVDEFVDASGNKIEMTEQRNILRPGEKFIYHYFTKLDKMYRYIGNIVDDMNSNGAQVKVTTYPVEHFLDLYFDKFPEEAGNFVFYVNDLSGAAVKDAKIKLNDNYELTTDTSGQAIIPREERNGIQSNHLTVTCKDYYDYSSTFEGVQLGTNKHITLYKLTDFVLEDVFLNGKSAVSQSCQITTNDTDENDAPSTATFIARIYGEVDNFDVYQNGSPIAYVSKGRSISEHLYQVVCSVDSFAKGAPIEFRVKNKDGDELVQPLNINVVTINFDMDIQLPENDVDITVNGATIDWFNGFNCSLNLTNNVSISAAWDRKNNTVTYGINVNENLLKNLSTPSGYDSIEQAYGHGADKVKDLYDKLKEQYEKAKAPNANGKKLLGGEFGKPKVNVFLQGAITFKVNDDGSLEFSKSKLYVGMSFAIGYSTNFVIGPVPVTAGLDFSLSGGIEASFEPSQNTGVSVVDADLIIKGSLSLSAGVGVSLASIGFYGSAAPEFDIILINDVLEPGVRKVTLTGEVGAYYKLLFFSQKFPIYTGKWIIYERSAAKKSMDESIGKAYNSDLYTVNTDIMSLNPYWASPVATSVGTTTMLDNAYSGTPAQIAVCGNKAVMVYQGVDRNADNVANALALYYSVYNPETMNWSVPKKLDSNQQADIDFTLVSNGDKAYVLYTQANSELSEDIGIFDVTKKIDVYSAEFDSSTETFSGFDRLTNDESYDTIPVIKTIGGSPTAVWTSNSEGSPFLSEGTNSIKLSKLENGEWSAPQTVVSTEDAIINCDVVASDRTPVVVYTTDADGDLVTADDRNLYVLNTANNESQTIAQGVTSAVEIGELMGNNVVMWYDNGEMKQYNAKTSAITSIDGIPSAAAKEFKIASDENGNNAIVFVSEGTIYAKYLNTETGSWSEPIAVASSENNIENISAEYVNGKLHVTYYDTKVTDSESMTTQSDLKTAVAANTPKPEITSASVDHENLVLGQEAEMQVTVRNSSSAPTGNLSFTVTNYDGTVLGSFTTENVSLNAGESQDFVVPFTVPDDIVNRDVKVTVTDSTKTGVSSKNVKLAVVDYGVNASQIYDGDKEYIKAVVYNNTNYTSPATLEVYNRFTDEVLYSTNISKVEKNYPVTAKIEIDNSYIDKNGYISVRIVTKAEDSFETDNTDMFQYIPKDAFDTPDLLIGDVNLDGEVDINDATEISKYLVNLITLEGKALATADVNGDADIDINDVTCIQKYLAKFTSYGNCGQKLTSRV